MNNFMIINLTFKEKRITISFCYSVELQLACFTWRSEQIEAEGEAQSGIHPKVGWWFNG